MEGAAGAKGGIALILPKDCAPRFITVRRGGRLQDSDHRLLALWAADCAQHVRPLFEAVQPADARPRGAIEPARAWVRGEVTMSQARTAAGHAQAAAREMGHAPGRCAYVDNRMDQDVAGAHLAKFGQAVLLHPSLETTQADIPAEQVPDRVISPLNDLLDSYPPLTDRRFRSPTAHKSAGFKQPRYDISLSTMWGIGNFRHLEDTFIAARRLGFDRLEINHQVSTTMLAGIELQSHPVGSIHEPCPAEVSAAALVQYDWIISSIDEDKRMQGITAVKRSIDLASQVGARLVVVHPGTVRGDFLPSKTVHALFQTIGGRGQAYLEMKQQMQATRPRQAEAHIHTVKRSLRELVEYARPRGICLGLENRYHYPGIPSPDELDELLQLAAPDVLGFVYDCGHGQALETLGFYPQRAWLDRFHSRLVGVHCHDILGLRDHLAPGTGEIDFGEIAGYLPDQVAHTLEVRPEHTYSQLRAGLAHLKMKGCM